MRRLSAGWILLPRFQRHGLMQDAMPMFLAYCFGELDTHRIEAEIAPDNRASVRLAERLGFQREGLLRDRQFVNGEPRDMAMYALLRTDWRRSS